MDGADLGQDEREKKAYWRKWTGVEREVSRLLHPQGKAAFVRVALTTWCPSVAGSGPSGVRREGGRLRLRVPCGWTWSRPGGGLVGVP